MTATAAPGIHTDRPSRWDRPSPIGQYKVRPLEALRAFRRIVANKEDTAQVFELIRALTGRSIPDGYQRLMQNPEGGRQAYLREELADKFCDKEWLAQFPEGTVGAAYRHFIGLRDLSAYGLAEESRKLGEDIDAAHPIAWYARRLRDIHDVWHVLTGYNTDTLGEACVVAFTHAQTRNQALGFLAAGAAYELEKAYDGPPYARAIWEGWRNGHKVEWLPAQDYERLFAEPLEAARARLKIPRPTIYDSVPVEARNAYKFDRMMAH